MIYRKYLRELTRGKFEGLSRPVLLIATQWPSPPVYRRAIDIMSETDALLPVTTTTRQRKSQQVIAARSSIGDTLVEETDGPQISIGS